MLAVGHPGTDIVALVAGAAGVDPHEVLAHELVLYPTEAPQGFGLGGEPGLWEDLYPGVDPALYGLDSDRPVLASDGARGWVVDAHYLAMIFGAGWRRVVYGN